MENTKLARAGECKGDVVKVKREDIYHDIRDVKFTFGRALQQAVMKGNKQECAKALIAGINKLEGINIKKSYLKVILKNAKKECLGEISSHTFF